MVKVFVSQGTRNMAHQLHDSALRWRLGITEQYKQSVEQLYSALDENTLQGVIQNPKDLIVSVSGAQLKQIKSLGDIKDMKQQIKDIQSRITKSQHTLKFNASLANWKRGSEEDKHYLWLLNEHKQAQTILHKYQLRLKDMSRGYHLLVDDYAVRRCIDLIHSGILDTHYDKDEDAIALTVFGEVTCYIKTDDLDEVSDEIDTD